MNKNQIKPQVGEIWEVNSDYSWGQCLVKIVDPKALRGYVLDARRGRRRGYYLEGQEKGPRTYWHFLGEQFIRRIEKAKQ